MIECIDLHNLFLIGIGFAGGLFWGWVFTSFYYNWKYGVLKTTDEIIKEMS